MNIYKIYVEQTGKMEEVRYFDAHTAADALVQAKVIFDWLFNGAYTIHKINPVEDQFDQPPSGVLDMAGIASIRMALNEIVERHRIDHPGGCRIFSRGNSCSCTLCLCGMIRDYVEKQARKA